MIVVGNQLWARCADCEKLIRVNKFLFGSLHVCLTPEEIAYKKSKAEQRNPCATASKETK